MGELETALSLVNAFCSSCGTPAASTGEKKKIDCGPVAEGTSTRFTMSANDNSVEPCKRNPALEALKCFLQMSEPIFFYWRVSNHHGHMGRFRPHSQNVLDDRQFDQPRLREQCHSR
jgi:hypothetical protein